MLERWQIYQKTVAIVPPGGIIGLPFTCESDAPFAFRRIKSRNIGLNGWRFQHPNKNYQSSFLRTDVLPFTNAGGNGSYFPTHGMPVYPQSIYPANGQIVFDIGNATNANLVDATLLFYGSKLFKDGSIDAHQYPLRMRPFPFVYPMTNPTNGENQGPITLGLATDAQHPFVVRDLQLKIDQDADFVVRSLVLDPFVLLVEGGITPVLPNDPSAIATTYGYTDVRVVLKDESRKPYMNEPINVNDVFGQLAPLSFGENTDNPGSGPIFPGLLTPELIVPREHSLYFDLYRYDTVGTPVDVWPRFGGAKLFTGQL